MKKSILAALLAATMLLGVSHVYAEAETAEAEAAAEVKAIGTEEEGAYAITVKNSTGKAITGVAVKDADAEEFGENLLAADDVFAADEERTLYFKAAEGEPEEGAEDDKLVNTAYDIQLTFEDEATAVLHEFPFDDMEACEFCQEDDVTFITYTRSSVDEEVNTKEAEQALAETGEAANKWADFSVETAHEPAASASSDSGSYEYYEEYDDSYDYDYSYDESYDSYDYSDAGSEDDGCVEDGLVY